MLREQLGELTELGIATDERGEGLGDGPAAYATRLRSGAHRRGRVQRWILREHCGLEPPQLGPRVEAELVAEDRAALLEHTERVGLSTGSVQRDHQQRPELLPQRMLVHERFQLDDRAGV